MDITSKFPSFASNLEVSVSNPLFALVWVSPFCPSPECYPDFRTDVTKHFFADGVAVVVSKASKFGIELFNDYLLFYRFILFEPFPDFLEEV